MPKDKNHLEYDCIDRSIFIGIRRTTSFNIILD